MNFVAFFQTSQNRDRRFQIRFVHLNWLKPPFEGGVLFDVLPILVERRGADATQFPSSELRLEQVRGVGRTFGSARPDQQMQLVDKQDDLAFPGGHFLEKRLQPLLEFSPILGAGD